MSTPTDALQRTDTLQKALRINLAPLWYGTIATPGWMPQVSEAR